MTPPKQRLVGSLLAPKPTAETKPPAPPRVEEPPPWMKAFVDAVVQIPALLAALVHKKPVPPPPPPAPHVEVKPHFQLNTPTAWDIEITERDRNGRAKKLSIKAVSYGQPR